MSIGILGNKVGMTQVFNKTGNAYPATVIKIGPCFVTQLKLQKTCGYNAVQIGYGEGNINNMKSAELGHLVKKNLPPLIHLKEYKVENPENFQVGQKIDINLLDSLKLVTVTGTTIGKGFTGNVKRHHFSTGAMTHGSKHHRLQGSLGAGTTPGRVFPGKKMSGRVGAMKRTVKNLEILYLDKDNNLLVVKGCIPGKTGNLVNISF